MECLHRNRSWALVALISAGFTTPARGQTENVEPEQSRLTRHVERLASPDFLGRRGAGARLAAQYLVDEFKALGLEPLFGDSYEQPFPDASGHPDRGRNVGARLPGVDPKLRDEVVIVSAHFDHLGLRGDRLYPGADDNASGVAMMLEVARAAAKRPDKPRRSLVFLGFDLEEAGLFGSRYFVEHPPFPLERVALFITADMVGRSLAGVCKLYVFVMGSEHAPSARPWLVQASSAGGPGLKVGILGSDLLLINRSDYGPFRNKRVPYLFFSTGESPVYHMAADVPETIDYPKLTAVTRVVASVTRLASDADARPAWTDRPDHPFAEALTIRDVLKTLLENKELLKVNGLQATLMGNALRTLDAIADRGSITPEERSGVLRVAQVVLMSLF